MDINGRPVVTHFLNFWVEIPHSADMVSMILLPYNCYCKKSKINFNAPFIVMNHFSSPTYKEKKLNLNELQPFINCFVYLQKQICHAFKNQFPK